MIGMTNESEKLKLMELICGAMQTDSCIAFCNHPHCGMVQTLADHLIENNVRLVLDKPSEIVNVECNIYDKEEVFTNCTVQVLTNTVTGDVSVGWWKND